MKKVHKHMKNKIYPKGKFLDIIGAKREGFPGTEY